MISLDLMKSTEVRKAGDQSNCNTVHTCMLKNVTSLKLVHDYE